MVGTAAVGWAAPVVANPGTTTGVNNVTAVTTQDIAGTPTSQSNVTAEGAAYSPFQAPSTYTVNYAGTVQQVNTVTAGGTTYAPAGLATSVIRRFEGAPTDNLWYKGTETGTTSGSSINVNGVFKSGFNQVFDTNNINVGADNLFSTVTTGTTANPVGDNTNVDRVDMLFRSGIKVSAASVFVIADRGESTDHDAFDMAAITSLDSNGNPATFGQLLEFRNGTWGTTEIQSRTEEEILRLNDNASDDTLHPSDHTSQPMGGVEVSTTALAGGASTIYGYALFSPELTVSGNGSGTQLVDFTNDNVYGEADSTSKGGGFDPAATVAELYTAVPVPEPTSAALIAAVGGLLLGRHRRRVAR